MANLIPTADQSQAGESAVEGIAIGRAILWAADPAPRRVSGSRVEEHTRLARSLARAMRGIDELVRLLPPSESELFEPEAAILAELGPALLVRVDAGMRAEDAVNEATSSVPTDLLVDVRARLLDGLAYDDRSVASLLEGRDGERVLVTKYLTPSVVASLPARVVGIIAAAEAADQQGFGYTSHAAILARGRDIPLAFVLPHVTRAIADDDTIILDATVNPAAVHISPTESAVSEARARRDAWTRTRSDDEAHVSAPLTHLHVEVHVNVGSVDEHVPASAEGIGLVRTEIVFSDHARAPSEAEQFCALRTIAARAGGAPVVVRLFDAGDDKPLAWLPPPARSSGARGIALLFEHVAVLDAQLRAIARAARDAQLRVLLPLVTSARDVDAVRARSPGGPPIGAMIETPEAVEQVDPIAETADFICIGTNDLSASVTGHHRADSTLAVDGRILRMIARIVESGHAHGRKVSVCGELAGDPHGARILIGLGVDVLSVSPARFAKVKHSLRDLSLDDCRGVAREAMK
jgi:phosphoenolpyruvate-protein kinase (PTS system EI component)